MQVDQDVDSIIRFEAGEMTHEEELKFFQGLINSGLAWKLPGKYARMAALLITGGFCNPANVN